MRDIPEVDFRTARVNRNLYARRIMAAGLVVQVGRRRPKQLLEPAEARSRQVRLSADTSALLEELACAKRLTLQDALRQAILAWAQGSRETSSRT